MPRLPGRRGAGLEREGNVPEAAAALLAWGQQVMQQQGDQAGEPTVCFAAVPLLIPAAVVAARSLTRQLRRLRSHFA